MIRTMNPPSESEAAGPSSLPALAAAVLRVPRDPERVLEIGCGEGDGVLFLAREFPRARIRGLDRSGEAIRAAVARTGLDPQGRVAFKAASGRRLPYPDDQFDLVVCSGQLPSLREIRRVLRLAGHVLLVRAGRTDGRWPRLRLRLHGLQIIESDPAGDGEFCVISLAGKGRKAPRE